MTHNVTIDVTVRVRRPRLYAALGFVARLLRSERLGRWAIKRCVSFTFGPAREEP